MIMKAIVYRDHTLGILHSNGYMTILNGNVSKGGLSSCHDEPPMVDKSEYRTATIQDFTDFRVVYNSAYEVQSMKLAS